MIYKENAMVELIPEYVNNAIVFMAYNKIPHCETKCKLCVDFSVGIHNWILANEVSYIIIDLQDEKTICGVFLEELVNPVSYTHLTLPTICSV